MSIQQSSFHKPTTTDISPTYMLTTTIIRHTSTSSYIISPNLCSHSLDFPFSKTALNTDVTTGVNTGRLKSQEIYTIARLRTIYDTLYKCTHHHHYHQYYNEESGSIKTGHYSINNTHATVHDTLKKSASKLVHMTKGVENN